MCLSFSVHVVAVALALIDAQTTINDEVVIPIPMAGGQ